MKRAINQRKKSHRAYLSPAAPVPETWLHEPFLERAADPKYQEWGQHSLGAFLTLRLVDRFNARATEMPRGALEYQINATRDYLLDLRPQNAETGHLLEMVRVAEAVVNGGKRQLLWSPLLAYAFWLEEELRLNEALDALDTALRLSDGTCVNEEAAANLQRGRVLRLLGRLDEARAAYETARDRALSVGDMHSVLLTRIGEANVLRQRGNLPASERALRDILKGAEEAGDCDAQARARHDLGLVLLERGRVNESVPHLYSAFELYERPSHRLRALSDVAEAMKRKGRYAAARDAFTTVLNAATPEMRPGTMIALLELSALLDDRISFARWRREIGSLFEQLPAERRVDFHLQLGIGEARFGHIADAERSLLEALSLAEQFRLNEYVFRAEAALKDLKSKSAPSAVEVPTALGADDAVDLAEIEAKLHVLRVQ